MGWEKNKMAANIVFVDEATINEVFSREDSDGYQSTSDAVSEHGESDVSEQERDIEEENEKNWVICSHEQTALDLTADQGLNVDLPDSPSFIDNFYLFFPEHLFEFIIHHIFSLAHEYSPAKTGEYPRIFPSF